MGRRQSLTLPTTQSQNTEDMDTLQEAEFNPKSPVEVHNLFQLEVDIEEENDANTQLAADDERYASRIIRSTRKEVDYWRLHNHGFES